MLFDANSLCIEMIQEVVSSGEAEPPVCNLHEIFEYILYEFNRLLFHLSTFKLVSFQKEHASIEQYLISMKIIDLPEI